jgi:hypothetical protein
MGFALLFLHPVTIIQLISSVILGILIYFLFMIFFKGIVKDQIVIAKNMLLEFFGLC